MPIGEKNVEASDPDYVPKEGEQATQEELAGADYESGACMRLEAAAARAAHHVRGSFHLQVLRRVRFRAPRRAPSSGRCAFASSLQHKASLRVDSIAVTGSDAEVPQTEPGDNQ